MRRYASLLLVLGAGCCGLVAANPEITADNGMPWRGVYGEWDFCPSSSNGSSYTYALEFKFDNPNDVDNMGGTAVKLYCHDSEGATVGYVSSLEGKRGEWQGIHLCPEDEFFDGFRLRVFPEQGTWGDDFAVDNIQLACSNGTIVDGIDGVLPASHMVTKEKKADTEDNVEKDVIREWLEVNGRKMEVIRLRSDIRKARIHGDWGSWAFCSPDMYVAGIRTVVEEGHIGDDAGLTDVALYCK